MTPGERYMLSQGQDPRPQRTPEPPPEPTQREITHRPPIGERFAMWCNLVIHFEAHYPYKLWFPRCRALAMWAVKTVFYRIPSFLRVVLGGTVPAWEYRNRMAACDTCVQCVKVAESRRNGDELHLFCGSCGCGQWILRIFGRVLATSALSWKNWFTRHDCPAGVHAGSQSWRDLIPEPSHDDETDSDSADDTDPADEPDRMEVVETAAPLPTFGDGGGRNDGV